MNRIFEIIVFLLLFQFAKGKASETIISDTIFNKTYSSYEIGEYDSTTRKKQGFWKTYSMTSNQLISIIEYDKGIKNGQFIEYYDSGNIKTIGQYTENIKTNFWILFYPSGSIHIYEYLDKYGDAAGIRQIFHPNGKLCTDQIWDDGSSKYFNMIRAHKGYAYLDLKMGEDGIYGGNEFDSLGRQVVFVELDTLDKENVSLNIKYCKDEKIKTGKLVLFENEDDKYWILKWD